jgi:hypothetical protein
MNYREKARKRANERSDGVWLKLKEGETTFRCLPTPESAPGVDDGMWMEYAVHREVGPKKETVRCGKSVPDRKGPCWICDVQIKKLRTKGNVTRAKALEPKDIFLIQAAKVEDDGTMSGPKLFTPSTTVATQLLTSIFGSKKRDYADPKKGYNITIERTGTGKNDTRYGMLQPDSDPTPVSAEIMEKLKPFSQLIEIPVYSEAKQKAAYVGQEAVEEPDTEEDISDLNEEDDLEEAEVEEEEEAPVKKTAKKGKAAKAAVAEEPEEDEVTDDLDTEEEIPAPKSKSPVPIGKPKKKAVVEEVDEDEDEDDDAPFNDEDEPEELEVPAAKKTKTVAKAKSVKRTVVEEDEDEDSDIEEDEEPEPEPLPVRKKAVAKGRR